jgi:hypothetical protein
MIGNVWCKVKIDSLTTLKGDHLQHRTEPTHLFAASLLKRVRIAHLPHPQVLIQLYQPISADPPSPPAISYSFYA